MFIVLVVMMVSLVVALIVVTFMVNNDLLSQPEHRPNPAERQVEHQQENDPFAAFSEELFKDEEEQKSEKDDPSDTR